MEKTDKERKMKAIVISEERMNQILPKNIKESDVLNKNEKKVLAVIMNYYAILDNAKRDRYVILSNDKLRAAAGINKNVVLDTVQSLIEYKLIQRERGKRRAKGEKAEASKYYIIWENLNKPLKKLTFEDIFSEFLTPTESSKTPSGTAVAVADSVTDSVSVSVTDSVNVSVNVNDNDSVNVSENVFENVSENVFEFEEECDYDNILNKNNNIINKNNNIIKKDLIENNNNIDYNQRIEDNKNFEIFKDKVERTFKQLKDITEVVGKKNALQVELDACEFKFGKNCYKRCNGYLYRRFNEVYELVNASN